MRLANCVLLCSSLLFSHAAAAAELPQRWVSSGGSLSEWVVRLGGEGKLVGVDTTSLHPQSLRQLPSVGYQRALSAEGVLSLRPDILIGSEEMGPPPVVAQIAAAVAVANLMVASIGERSGELALLKALGATDAAVSRLMLAETAAISLLGAIVGALLGSGVAQLIGRVVFGSGITMRPMVFVLVFVLLAVTVLLASASSIRSILNLKPAEVLHGR